MSRARLRARKLTIRASAISPTEKTARSVVPACVHPQPDELGEPTGVDRRRARHEAPAPAPRELHEIVRTVHRRALRWLPARGYRPKDSDREGAALDADPDVAASSSLDACATAAAATGAFLTMREDGTLTRPILDEDAREFERRQPRRIGLIAIEFFTQAAAGSPCKRSGRFDRKCASAIHT